MENISWDPKWEIGNELIDSQHKTLVKLINDLYFSCNKKEFDVATALSFLMEYAVTHFNDEEALQLSCGFPGYKQHKKMHKELKATVSKLVARYLKSGSSSDLKSSLSKVLATWLIEHIKHEDKKIADYI